MNGDAQAVSLIAAVGLPAISLVWSASARAENEVEVAEYLIELIKIGSGVVSEHQATITDATKAGIDLIGPA